MAHGSLLPVTNPPPLDHSQCAGLGGGAGFRVTLWLGPICGLPFDGGLFYPTDKE
jgi:hypothetical protein